MPGLAEIAGLSIGHWSDPAGHTGCSVILCPSGATASVDVRGAAPATRETDLLKPGNLVQQVHAIVLTGGSAFGLAAADGVMRWLEERGHGFATPAGPVPIVPAAALYDLGSARPGVRPGPEAGYTACEAAGPQTIEGQVGAGTGATVGKLFGPNRAHPGGLGIATVALPDGVIVGALIVVNAFGHVVDPGSGAIIAGPRDEHGRFVDTAAALLGDFPRPTPSFGTNTTIGVVFTNAPLDRAGCSRVAAQAHDGLALSIRPAHTIFDGDALFVLSLPPADAVAVNLLQIASAATQAVAEAIVRAVSTPNKRQQPGHPA